MKKDDSCREKEKKHTTLIIFFDIFGNRCNEEHVIKERKKKQLRHIMSSVVHRRDKKELITVKNPLRRFSYQNKEVVTYEIFVFEK
jgi:hypothetical protein